MLESQNMVAEERRNPAEIYHFPLDACFFSNSLSKYVSRKVSKGSFFQTYCPPPVWNLCSCAAFYLLNFTKYSYAIQLYFVKVLLFSMLWITFLKPVSLLIGLKWLISKTCYFWCLIPLQYSESSLLWFTVEVHWWNNVLLTQAEEQLCGFLSSSSGSCQSSEPKSWTTLSSFPNLRW